jgi:heterodisulfide reductase subunit A-like polyferredoxin
MNIKVLLCNCKGLCPSFKDADMNTLPFEIESELEVQYAVVHPQLCGQGGNAVLRELMRESAADPEATLLVGACAPAAQQKLFKKLLRETQFDAQRFVPADIRSTDNPGIVARLRAAAGPLLKHAAPPADSLVSIEAKP